LVERYAAQYGVSQRSVRIIGVTRLARMAPHARATVFSSLKWEHNRRRFTLANFGKEEISAKKYFVLKPKTVILEEKVAEILRLMQLTEKASA
jgi:hypothetical protein